MWRSWIAFFVCVQLEFRPGTYLNLTLESPTHTEIMNSYIYKYYHLKRGGLTQPIIANEEHDGWYLDWLYQRILSKVSLIFLYVSGGNLLKRPPRKTLKSLVSDAETCSCLKTKHVQSTWRPNINSKRECDFFKRKVENSEIRTKIWTKQIDWNPSLTRIEQHVTVVVLRFRNRKVWALNLSDI